MKLNITFFFRSARFLGVGLSASGGVWGFEKKPFKCKYGALYNAGPIVVCVQTYSLISHTHRGTCECTDTHTHTHRVVLVVYSTLKTIQFVLM